MGILKSIKNLFSKGEIKPDISKMGGLITVYPLKSGIVKINTKISIPEGYDFALGYKGHALDVFHTSENVLSFANLPECCRKLKIDKKDDDGKLKNKFKANAYFVNLKEYEYSWETYEKAEIGGRLGIYRIGAIGNIKFSIKETKLFMQSMLNEFDYIKNGEAEEIFRNYLSQSIVRCFQKYNFAINDIVSNSVNILEKCKQDVSKMCLKIGISLIDFEINDYILPKKLKKQFLAQKEKREQEKGNYDNNNIANQKEDSKEEDSKQDSKAEDSKGDSKAKEISFSQTKQVNNETQQEFEIPKIECEEKVNEQNEYIPFGNFQIDKIGDKKIESHEIKTESIEIDENGTQFVDLNIDNLYKDKKDTNKTKRCLACGAENDESREYCILCGEKLE